MEGRLRGWGFVTRDYKLISYELIINERINNLSLPDGEKRI